MNKTVNFCEEKNTIKIIDNISTMPYVTHQEWNDIYSECKKEFLNNNAIENGITFLEAFNDDIEESILLEKEITNYFNMKKKYKRINYNLLKQHYINRWYNEYCNIYISDNGIIILC
jgi:hypothetical protein